MSVCFVRPSEQAEKNGVRPNSNSVGPFSWCFLCACSMFSAYSLMFCFHRNNKKNCTFFKSLKGALSLTGTHARTLTRTHIAATISFHCWSSEQNRTEQRDYIPFCLAGWRASKFICVSMRPCMYENVWTCFKDKDWKGREQRKREQKNRKSAESSCTAHMCILHSVLKITATHIIVIRCLWADSYRTYARIYLNKFFVFFFSCLSIDVFVFSSVISLYVFKTSEQQVKERKKAEKQSNITETVHCALETWIFESNNIIFIQTLRCYANGIWFQRVQLFIINKFPTIPSHKKSGKKLTEISFDTKCVFDKDTNVFTHLLFLQKFFSISSSSMSQFGWWCNILVHWKN